MTRSLTGERIGVLGLARSGRAAARLALARGAYVYASDGGDSAEMMVLRVHPLAGAGVVAADERVQAAIDAQEQERQFTLLAGGIDSTAPLQP